MTGNNNGERNEPQRKVALNRRNFLQAAIGVGIGGSLLARPVAANPISAENNKEGDQHWRRTRDPSMQAPEHAVEGYTSQTSVAPGETIEFHVSTNPPQRYRTEIHRLGWYDDLGGRRVVQLSESQGSRQPIPDPDPETGKLDASWDVTDTFSIPKQYPSGIYIAEFILTTGPHQGKSRWYPFIVRARGDRARSAKILVAVPTSTWQAYNNWGGKSLYGFNSDGGPADIVSYNRPLRNPLSPHTADGGPMAVYYWEYMILRFLEREGYDISYVTNEDIDRNPSQLRDHREVLVTGHNEYWSKTERDGFEAARDAGVNLLFICSNTCYWQVRYEDDARTLIGYKSNVEDDPLYGTQRQTSRFRDLPSPRPECELMGVQYDPPIVANTSENYPAYPLVETALDHPWMADTGFEPGAQPNDLVGYELDHIVPGCDVPGELTVFFDFQPQGEFLDSGQGGQAVAYTASSGAQVFSTGSMNFAWGLSDFAPPVGPTDAVDVRVQQFIQNILADMTKGSKTNTRVNEMTSE